jgi:hypothetical protein
VRERRARQGNERTPCDPERHRRPSTPSLGHEPQGTRPENGGRAERRVIGAPRRLRPPVPREGGEGAGEPHLQKPPRSDSSGDRPREGNRSGGPHVRLEQTREGAPIERNRPAPTVSDLERPGNRTERGDGDIPEGNPLAHPLAAIERWQTTETERNAPPTDLGPCGTKRSLFARAKGVRDERQEGSRPQRCGPAADEEKTFEGWSAQGHPAHGPRWTFDRKVGRAPTNAEGPTWRTPDLVPAENTLEARNGANRRGGRNHEGGTRREAATS